MKILYGLLIMLLVISGISIFQIIDNNQQNNNNICNVFSITNKYDETALKLFPFDSTSTYTYTSEKYQHERWYIENNFLIEANEMLKHIKINSNLVEIYYSDTIEPQIRATGENLYSLLKQADECRYENHKMHFIVILPKSSATIAAKKSLDSPVDSINHISNSNSTFSTNNGRALKMHIATHNLKNPALGIL